MKISYDVKIKLNPITFRQDKKNFIVEDKKTGEFFEMPEVCVSAIERINEGLALDEIENELKIKYPNEEVDLIGFTYQLLEMQMIHDINGQIIDKTEKQSEKLGFAWISPKFGKLFFNRYTNSSYFVLFITNIILFSYNPHLFPHYTDIFITDSMTINLILWFLVGGFLIFIHEFGHILAIRAEGYPTKLSIGNRLFLIVLETDLTLAWKLAPRKRNMLYLAGLSFDNVTLFIGLLIQMLFPGTSNIFSAIINFIVLDVVIRILYQFCIYMKTDLYYVFENITSCYNLMESSIDYLKDFKSQTILFKEERNIIFLYGILFIIGTGISVSLFVLFYIPQVIGLIMKVIASLKEPITSLSFWDSFLVIVQILIASLILILSWKNKNKAAL